MNTYDGFGLHRNWKNGSVNDPINNIDEFPIMGTAATQSASYLFDVNCDNVAKLLEEEQARDMHIPSKFGVLKQMIQQPQLGEHMT